MTIHWSQVILLIALGGFIFYVLRLRSIALVRVIYLICAVIGVILVIDPDLSTSIAHLLGIGRGTDLLLYLFIVVTLFYSATLNSEMRNMRRQITTIVREMAIANPVEGEGDPAHPLPASSKDS